MPFHGAARLIIWFMMTPSEYTSARSCTLAFTKISGACAPECRTAHAVSCSGQIWQAGHKAVGWVGWGEGGKGGGGDGGGER